MLAILGVATMCLEGRSAVADGSGAAPDTASKAKPAPPEEEAVAPTGLIIAGVALAAFAVVLLLGRRKRAEPHRPAGQLAEVRLVIESDERATVWTKPSFKLPTDRLGEVVLNLPVGTHDVHMQVGNEVYTRAVVVDAVKRMRIQVNIAKEQIARTASGEQPTYGAPTHAKGLLDVPRPQKAPTSAARAFPDSASQGKLGAQLAGLIDVELDKPAAPKGMEVQVRIAPVPPKAAAPPRELDMRLDPGASGDLAAIDFSPEPVRDRTSSPTRPPPVALTLDLGPSDEGTDFEVSPIVIPAGPTSGPRASPLRDVPARSRPQTGPLEGIVKKKPPPATTERPNLDISLDDLPPRRTQTRPPPRPAVGLDDLDELAPSNSAPIASEPEMPASNFELAPPTRPIGLSRVPSKPNLPSVMDFALDEMVPPRAPAPVAPMPKVSAASVSDLSLDDDDLPIQRIPAPPRTSPGPTPSVNDFTLDDSFEVAKAPPKLAAPPVPPSSPMAPPVRPSSPTASPAPGSPTGTGLIGNRYRKLSDAGPGPLGTLYRGRDEKANREILIEEVPRETTLPNPLGVIAGLLHPNLVRFYDHITDLSKGYLITEVVEGKSLKQLLAERGPFASLEAIAIVDQVCSALGAAHERGVFHRGLRPACIVMSGRTAKVMGFATTLAARSLPYTAPELAAGGSADARCDLYSVGVTLAELLTGSVPTPGKLEFPSDVPRNLASLIRKLLSREPTIRPASTKVVRDAFSAVF